MPQSNCGFAPGVDFQAKMAGATTVPPAIEANKELVLEIKLQSELKLARIISCRRTAVIMAVAGSLLEGINIVNKTGHRAFVEAVE